ncbi:MAG: hypothetical protein HY661_12065 [Betaproteobacteria bacterium]|nr:hypothetical protein [Betaproteobacteria bacterium]
MATNRIVAGMAVLGATVSFAAFSQASDVGLVNMLAGDVSYQSGNAAPGKTQAFMKVRQGDRFTVPAGAQVRVVYFQGGRQETWKGPVVFRAGSQQSEPASGSPAEVATLPSAVPYRISQIPELIQIARIGRSGGVQVRGAAKSPRLTAEQKAEVASAQDNYRKLRAASTADDVTPELYLYTVLQDYLLYDDMKPVAEDMVKRQPNNADLQALLSWVRSKTQ